MKFSKEELLQLATVDGGKFKVDSLYQAYSFCKKIASGHYENFPVASVLVPKSKRNFFYAVYAYSRTADDIADELTDETAQFRIDYLDKFQNLLKAEHTTNPIFWALSDTKEKLSIPDLPFQNLVVAFKRDSEFKQPEIIDELLDYCKYSANPVGELVLRIFGEYNEKNAVLSDKICTGLQLVNFWQDISIDILKDRIYIPRTYLQKNNIKIEYFKNKNLHNSEFYHIFKVCLNELFDFNVNIFSEGKKLIKEVKNWRLKLELAITVEAGMYLLKKLKKIGAGTISNRVYLKKVDFIRIFFQSLKNLF